MVVSAAPAISLTRSRVMPARSAAAGVEAVQVGEQRRERRRRRRDELADGLRIAARFDVALAQMDQMALGLQLDAAAQIRVADAQSGEHVLADHDLVAGDDAAVLEREDVERAQELVLRQDQRRGRASLAPVRRARRARREIGKGDPFDECQGVHSIRRRHRRGRPRPIAGGFRRSAADPRPAPSRQHASPIMPDFARRIRYAVAARTAASAPILGRCVTLARSRSRWSADRDSAVARDTDSRTRTTDRGSTFD